jgi:hypothetical protein
MKLSRTNVDKNCLSFDLVSVSFTYFVNPAHRSLKYDIQFLSINTPQHLLHAPKKMILVSQLNPSEF